MLINLLKLIWTNMILKTQLLIKLKKILVVFS